jgi:hypothetical protein
MPKHPLHFAVASAIRESLSDVGEWLRDPACGGDQHLPLFVGNERNSQSRLCCVDMVLIQDGKVRVIIEIEESGFLPTKVCGKYLQAALCRTLLHRNLPNHRAPFADQVSFLHVLDGSSLKPASRKKLQATTIESGIRDLLPRVRGISSYALMYVGGENDAAGLEAVVRRLRDVVA